MKNPAPRDAGAGWGMKDGLDEGPNLTAARRRAQVCQINDPQFRRAITRIHALGPRPLGELIAELHDRAARGGCSTLAITAAMTRYATIDPIALYRLDGDRWPTLPLHGVSP